MATTVQISALLIAGGVATLQFFVFLIARFYQKSSGEPTRYWLFLLSMVLMLVGDGLYVWKGPPLLGNLLADLLLFAGGAVLMGNSVFLLRAMTRGN